ncbi:hypothetical protein KR018_002611 [Drosophila ironensis]|nr:hypothetical protein KR018_002611 [Drosophila ironensis]
MNSAVHDLKDTIEAQNTILKNLANATEALPTKSDGYLRNCAVTDKYGYIRIQLEKGSRPFVVFCEQALDEGGWTLVLQRFNGTQRTAKEFREGYNSIQAGEYFLGTDKLYALTHSRDHELLFVLEFADLTKLTFQAPRFVLNSSEAHIQWAKEQETAHSNWQQWQSEMSRIQDRNPSQIFSSSQMQSLESCIVYLLKWNFGDGHQTPIAGRPAIRLYKLLIRPSNAYWTVKSD